jgi:hypothetical protein
MKHLKITPDSRLNNQNVEHLARSLCLYKSPLERWKGKKFERVPFVSFETVIAPETTHFVLTIPEELESLAMKSIETTWPKVAVESTEDPLNITPNQTATLSLHNHYMFSLKTDKKLGALPSILETTKSMEQGEVIYIQVISTPAEKDWYIGAVNAYERFKKGEMPQKYHFNKNTLIKTGVKIAAATALEVASITTELITGKEMEKVDLNGSERAVILKDGKLSTSTLNKTRAEAYETEIRVSVKANNPNRETALLRMITMSFRELDGENYLISSTSKKEKTWQKMKARKVGNLINKDYLSVQELSRFFVLPTRELQEKYKIPNIDNLEIEVGNILTKGGLYLGDVEVKRKSEKVFQSIENDDITCLPRVVIGGMGSGKTRGYASNFIVESVRNGFGALAIDPAKGEIYEEVSSVLPSDKIIKIQLGQQPISLDWREVSRSPKAKNRLANTILGFFNTANEEAGAQTSRYIRAVVMAMQTGKLSEIIRIFEDEDYRNKLLELMPEGIHKTTLTSFGKETDNRKRQILSPIYNRLDIILGDEYLSECMESDEGLDLVELMEEKKAVIINVPKSDLGPDVVDLIVNLLSSKLDLAMTLRSEEKQHPFFAVFDEPHQFLKSAKTWKAAAVESRKWRLGYVWLFHSWEQIPRDLAEIIKAAGPHYSIYNSSKKTFKDLAEEIAPYTIEDGLKLKRWYAINVLRAGTEIQKPFICKMAPPPSKNKSNLT